MVPKNLRIQRRCTLSSHPQDVYLSIICDDIDLAVASFLWNRDRRRPDMATIVASKASQEMIYITLYTSLRSARELFCVLMLPFYRASRPSFRLDITHTQQYVLEGSSYMYTNTFDLSAWRRTRYWYWILWYAQQSSLSCMHPEYMFICNKYISQYMINMQIYVG